ncbi:HAMP domain-containing histidine kinase [Pseudoalteromonas sp. MMG010]|uniref:sensor histidine kinase n=1 Tax=Pseudoalteromonas sp. MMG010 TaxID=2822685 RepID=UPI001B3A4203|nr:HAMP domain-containing sensor histidine kinase [Pseudoalteromonas sp. MMG010]MBQ4833794.1 HAMP domain-containing histidine kinase [Pseudoalteromonas sp. MMG010]
MQTNSLANRLRLVLMLSGFMVIVFTLIIGFLSYQIKSTSERIVENDLPFSINALLMFEELVHMNGNLLEYLLGESEVTERYNTNYNELGLYRDKIPHQTQHHKALTEIDTLVEKFHSTAKNSVFNIYSPVDEQQAINDITSLITSVAQPLEHSLDEFTAQEIEVAQTSLNNDMLKTHLSVIRYYLKLVDIAGDITNDLNRFVLGDTQAKASFESHNKDFQLYLNQLKDISGKEYNINKVAEIETLFKKLIQQGESIFLQYDPRSKAMALKAVNELEQTTFYYTDTLLDALAYEGRETVKNSVNTLNNKAIMTLLIIILLSLIICSLLLLTFAYAHQRVFTPIKFVTTAIASLRAGQRNIKTLDSYNKDDELGSIVEHILGFQRELIELDELRKLDFKREKELIKQRDKANKALADLQLTQEKLINQEKQALTEKVTSLNALVAGVAHEVNTPLGVCITITTSMHEGITTFFENLLKNTLSKSDVFKFEKHFDESMVLLLSATQRAITLVEEFKQVAVDHISAKREKFDIVKVVGAKILVLNQKSERRDIKYEFNSDNTLLVESYPQELIQVVNHLYHNAVHHGFAKTQSGVIRVSVTADGNHADIVFQDNGEGIDKGHLNKIFDPFFTTTPGAGGGCGLGLHIVHNIVTNLLGGSIKLTSEKSKGTLVHISIPIDAPDNVNKKTPIKQGEFTND